MQLSRQAYLLLISSFIYLIPSLNLAASEPNMAPPKDLQIQKQQLGQALFFDPILSLSNTQSCATCHDPNHAFIDKRANQSGGAGSLGHDGFSFGDRNTPSAAYANQIPEFHQNKNGEYIGGMFWDGRENDLKSQAGGPPLNPIEMAMPNKQAILERIKLNSRYNASFKKIFGVNIFNSADATYEAIKESIAAFETSNFFSPFDSKYDRYLKGEYELNEEEELGMTLFFSEQFTNCNQCHLLNKRPLTENETFSDYRYHNIGVPANKQLRALNNSKESYVDTGLLNNPAVSDLKEKGKFKTPSLRNVAITGPFMHNGVFKDLKTVVAFYNKYNSKKPENQINPETLKHWEPPEIDENLSLDLLKKGAALNETRIDAILAFLNMLTDKRFETIK